MVVLCEVEVCLVRVGRERSRLQLLLSLVWCRIRSDVDGLGLRETQHSIRDLMPATTPVHPASLYSIYFQLQMWPP